MLTLALSTLLACWTPAVPYQGEVLDFYSRSRPYDEFSNFALFPVFVDGQWWATSEHYFQAMKYESPELQAWVQSAETPEEAARRGRDPQVPKRKDWEDVRDEVMARAVWDKFTRHECLRDLLISTGQSRIFEHTTNDCYWGDCGDRTGKNKLGLLLEEVRAKITPTAFTPDSEFKMFSFDGGQSVELRGEADYEALKKALAPYDAVPTEKTELTIGAYEYPFFFKRYREFWMAARAKRDGRADEYTYFYLVTDSPYTRWLNDGLRYKLVFEKGTMDLGEFSFSVKDLAVVMDPKKAVTRAPHTVRIEHYESKVVSVFKMWGEALERDFDPAVDSVTSSKLLRELKFRPKRWIVKKSLAGDVHVPLRRN